MFKRTIGTQLSGDTGHSAYKGHRALDTSNWYFTPKSATDDGDGLPLGADVDHHGFLYTDGAGETYIHIEDNKVRYYEKGVSKRAIHCKHVPHDHTA